MTQEVIRQNLGLTFRLEPSLKVVRSHDSRIICMDDYTEQEIEAHFTSQRRKFAAVKPWILASRKSNGFGEMISVYQEIYFWHLKTNTLSESYTGR